MTTKTLGTALPERIASRIDTDAPNGHWLWTGAQTPGGYGVARYEGRVAYLHRITYTVLVGSIPSGHEIDHLCRVRSCCNPDHLEAVTPRVNKLRSEGPSAVAARRNACAAGHPYVEGSFQIRRGKRECILCRRREPARQRNAGKPAMAYELTEDGWSA